MLVSTSPIGRNRPHNTNTSFLCSRLEQCSRCLFVQLKLIWNALQVGTKLFRLRNKHSVRNTLITTIINQYKTTISFFLSVFVWLNLLCFDEATFAQNTFLSVFLFLFCVLYLKILAFFLLFCFVYVSKYTSFFLLFVCCMSKNTFLPFFLSLVFFVFFFSLLLLPSNCMRSLLRARCRDTPQSAATRARDCAAWPRSQRNSPCPPRNEEMR
jgi:hypothetical protein